MNDSIRLCPYAMTQRVDLDERAQAPRARRVRASRVLCGIAAMQVARRGKRHRACCTLCSNVRGRTQCGDGVAQATRRARIKVLIASIVLMGLVYVVHARAQPLSVSSSAAPSGSLSGSLSGSQSGSQSGSLNAPSRAGSNLAPSTNAGPGSSAPLTVLAQAAQRIGVHRCLSAIAQVSERASPGAVHQDIVLDWDRAAPDRGALFSLTGLQYEQASAVLSLTTVPQASGNCAVMAERISSVPLACAELARQQLGAYQGTDLVRAVRVFTSARARGETITLVDTPPSCVVIKRQVQYEWPGAG